MKLINNFLNNRFHRVQLNGQISDWLSVKAEVPQGSISRPPIFFIYINNLAHNLVSPIKLFVDGISLVSIVHDTDASRTAFNNDLKKESEWEYKR